MNVEDVFKDIRESVLDRYKNTFVISFVLAWLYFNWPILFAFLSFNDLSSSAKLSILKGLVSEARIDRLSFFGFFSLGSTQLWWKPLGLTFLGTLIYQVLSTLIILVNKTFHLKVKTPAINKIDPKSIVLIEDYNKLDRLRDKLDTENRKLKKEYNEHLSTVEEAKNHLLECQNQMKKMVEVNNLQEKEIIEKDLYIKEQQKALSEQSNNLVEKDRELEKLVKTMREMYLELNPLKDVSTLNDIFQDKVWKKTSLLGSKKVALNSSFMKEEDKEYIIDKFKVNPQIGTINFIKAIPTNKEKRQYNPQETIQVTLHAVGSNRFLGSEGGQFVEYVKNDH